MQPARILNTRSREQAPALSQALREAGLTPIEVPAIEFKVLSDEATIQRHIKAASWLLFTSENGFKFSQAALASLPASAKIAALGKKTAGSIVARGFQVDFCGREANAESFAGELLEHFELTFGKDFARELGPVAILRAKQSNPELCRLLQTRGLEVRDIAVYDTREAELTAEEIERIRQNFSADRAPGIDLLTCTSSQTVHNLLALLSRYGSASRETLLSLPLAVIGAKTAYTAAELGFLRSMKAPEMSIESLVETVRNYTRISS